MSAIKTMGDFTKLQLSQQSILCPQSIIRTASYVLMAILSSFPLSACAKEGHFIQWCGMLRLCWMLTKPDRLHKKWWRWDNSALVLNNSCPVLIFHQWHVFLSVWPQGMGYLHAKGIDPPQRHEVQECVLWQRQSRHYGFRTLHHIWGFAGWQVIMFSTHQSHTNEKHLKIITLSAFICAVS